MKTNTNFTQYREAHPICIYYPHVLLYEPDIWGDLERPVF